MENDIYIKVLKFALKRGNKGLSYKEFEEEFGSDKEAIWVSALKNQSLTHMRKEGVEPGTFTSYFILSFEARFKLIEYQELKEARKSSLTATCIAIAALFVSIASTSFSIYHSIEQADAPIQLEASQVEALNGREIKNLVVKLNDTQKAIHSELKIIRNTNNEVKSQNGIFQQATKEQLDNIILNIDAHNKSMKSTVKESSD